MGRASYQHVTSESVGAGHPDKICDQVADNILDEVLFADPKAHVAVEVMASNRLITIGGEIRTAGYVDVVKSAWSVLTMLGYGYNDFVVTSNINSQSAEINKKVAGEHEFGAGDQGVVYGFACRETPELMPLPVTLANRVAEQYEERRRYTQAWCIGPDAKFQVLVDYGDDKPFVRDVVASVQVVTPDYLHYESAAKTAKSIVFDVINDVLLRYDANIANEPDIAAGTYLDFTFHFNPGGRFTIGGPVADTGLTGRKLMVDTYGGVAHHGGGAMSGKDPTKVDRSGAYLARYIAKNIVASGLLPRCEVQLSYVIGFTHPVDIQVQTFGVNPGVDMVDLVKSCFLLSVKKNIDHLQLEKNIYQLTATFGHFGRNDFTWEATDKVNVIKRYLRDKRR